MDQSSSGSFTSIELALQQPDKVRLLDLSNASYDQLPEEIVNFKELKSLLLSSLSEPVPTWISQLDKLEYLEIVQHNFDQIPDPILDLHDLRVLRLGESYEGKGIRRLEENLLRCKSLEKLELDFNPVEYIANGLSNHPKLITLNLNGERETRLEYFPKLPNLKHLELEDFLMERMPAGLEYCVALETISLAHNNLKSIDLSTFTSLKELILNTNQIKSIETQDPLPNLERLELGSNGLTLFPGDIRNFSELEELDLSHNDLIKLPSEITILKNLRKLNLRNNELRDLPHSWGDMKALEHVNLSQNQLRDLPASTKELGRLQHLDLSQNKLMRLPPIMGEFKDLSYLNLNLNQFFSQSYSIPDSLGELESLRTLNMGNNQLEFLPDCFTNLSLERLDLSNNSISFLPEDLSKWNGLKQLYLQNNPIIKLGDNLKHLSSLEYLNLDHVSIMDWTENLKLIGELPNLKSLSLRFNTIHGIGEASQYLKNLQSIDLRRNSLNEADKQKVYENLSEHCKIYV